MALPTLVKTWQYNVNQTIAAAGTALDDNRKLLKAIKDSLLGFGSGAWTTSYSCNGITAGTPGDGVDRWTTEADIVWALPGAHSWYVLKQTNIDANFEVLLECKSSSQALTIVMTSTATFTGGTTTSRPTATNEVYIKNNGYWGGAPSDVQQRLHVMMSTDGQCTRIIMCDTNSPKAFWLFDKVSSPVANWATPAVGFAYGVSNLGGPAMLSLIIYQSANFKAFGNSAMDLYLTCEGKASAPLFSSLTVPNDLSADYPLFATALVSETAGNKGRHGRMVDLYYGLSNLSNGDTYPGDGSNQFAQFGCLVLPWNGSTPALT